MIFREQQPEPVELVITCQSSDEAELVMMLLKNFSIVEASRMSVRERDASTATRIETALVEEVRRSYQSLRSTPWWRFFAMNDAVVRAIALTDAWRTAVEIIEKSESNEQVSLPKEVERD